MSLPLEDTIMRDIGFGNHFYWYNGSSSCRWIRQEAARQLPDAIRTQHQKGEKVVAPVNALIHLVQTVANWERGDATLTITWQIASDVIRAHMELCNVPEAERPEHIRKEIMYLQECYPLATEVERDGLCYDYNRGRYVYRF